MQNQCESNLYFNQPKSLNLSEYLMKLILVFWKPNGI